MRYFPALLVSISLIACAGAPSRVESLDLSLVPTHAAFTVLIFYSPDCHCLATHDARIAALDGQYAPRGVQFFMVDSEMGADEARDAEDARRRGYAFPVLVDRGGKLAARAGALYATYSVLLDATGHVLYRGGIDSDRDHLRDDSTPYLRDALDDALGGRPVRIFETKTLGCSLRTW